MKIDELITKLQEIKEKEGNLEVYLEDSEFLWPYQVEKVFLTNYGQERIVIVDSE